MSLHSLYGFFITTWIYSASSKSTFSCLIPQPVLRGPHQGQYQKPVASVSVSHISRSLSHTLHLSEYLVSQRFILFKLPVGSKKEPSAAGKFRNGRLKIHLNINFKNITFFVFYADFKAIIVRLTRQTRSTPLFSSIAKVHIIMFTGRQYEPMLFFTGKSQKIVQKTSQKFDLFLKIRHFLTKRKRITPFISKSYPLL